MSYVRLELTSQCVCKCDSLNVITKMLFSTHDSWHQQVRELYKITLDLKQ